MRWHCSGMLQRLGWETSLQLTPSEKLCTNWEGVLNHSVWDGKVCILSILMVGEWQFTVIINCWRISTGIHSSQHQRGYKVCSSGCNWYETCSWPRYVIGWHWVEHSRYWIYLNRKLPIQFWSATPDWGDTFWGSLWGGLFFFLCKVKLMCRNREYLFFFFKCVY